MTTNHEGGLRWVDWLAQALLLVVLLRVSGTLTPEFTPINFEDLRASAFAAETSASDVYNQLFWLGIAVGVTLCVAARPSVLGPYLRSLWPLAALLLFCLLSALWATHPGISFRRTLLLIIGVYSSGIAVVYCRNSEVVLRTVYIAFAIALLLNIATVAFPFSFDSRGLFRGAVGDKNFLGVVAAVGLAITATWGMRLSSIVMRCINLASIAGWILIIVMTGAKTAIALCVLTPLAGFILTLITSRLHLALHASLTLFAIICGTLTSLVIFGLGLTLSDVVGLFVSDVTFTGRDVVWQFILEQIQSKWLLGFGYGSFWGVGLDAPNLRAEHVFIRVLTQAHNGYLDIALAIGPFGLGLALAFLFQLCAYIGKIRKLSMPLYQFSLFIFIFTIIHNLTDSNLLRGVSCLWIMIILVAFTAAKEIHASRRLTRNAFQGAPPERARSRSMA